MKIATVEYTPGGPRLIIAGVAVREWLGNASNGGAWVLADHINEAINQALNARLNLPDYTAGKAEGYSQGVVHGWDTCRALAEKLAEPELIKGHRRRMEKDIENRINLKGEQ